MGLHKLLNEIVLKDKKNQFLFPISKVHQYFCCRDSNFFCREFMLKLCKDQPIDVFTTYIFQSFMGFRESSSIKIWWNFICSLKIWSLHTDLLPELWKESNWLTLWLCLVIELFTPETVKLLSLPNITTIISATSILLQQKFTIIFSKFFCPRFVYRNFFFILMSFNVNGASVVNKSDIAFTTRF